MPLFDFMCKECGKLTEEVCSSNVKELERKCDCGGKFERIFPIKAPKFRLVYDNKTDMCDWEGNTSQYWNEYKKQKAEGKNVRIPELDGDA